MVGIVICLLVIYGQLGDPMVEFLTTTECTNDSILNQSFSEVGDYLDSTATKFWVSITFQLVLFGIEVYQVIMDRV